MTDEPVSLAPSETEVFTDGGMLWRPDSATTATFEEFVAARRLFREVNQDAQWNPWVRDERAAETEQAMTVMEQWHRAEPGFKQKTTRQVDAMLARWDREFKRDRARLEQRQTRDCARYDSGREANRLALLEVESRLAFETNELEQWRDGSKFFGITGERRNREIADAEESVAALRRRVDQLVRLVGDRETVVNERGALPADRRQDMFNRYRWDREQAVKQFKQLVAEQAATLKTLKGRAERAPVREKLREAQDKLDKLLAVPPLTPDVMCSECPTPVAHHGWTYPSTEGPCWAWPRTRAQREEFRRVFDEMVERNQREHAPPPPPKPQPLAIVESGLPVVEVIARLQELQAQYPHAEVRRGRANRWELWPAPEPER